MSSTALSRELSRKPSEEGKYPMTREQRLSGVFVELADTLVTDFNAVDLMHTLAERSVELLPADSAGLILADQRGNLQVVASTSHQTRVLELFALQAAEGPCLDCFTSGQPVANISPDAARGRWPRFASAAATAGYLSVHAVPMRLREDVIGVLTMFCVEQVTMSADQLALIQALADVATIGLLQERAGRQKDLAPRAPPTTLNSRGAIRRGQGRAVGAGRGRNRRVVRPDARPQQAKPACAAGGGPGRDRRLARRGGAQGLVTDSEKAPAR